MNTESNPGAAERELIEQVVDWHNRHWLSARITADQVGGIGIVALPFAAGDSRHVTVPAPGQSTAVRLWRSITRRRSPPLAAHRFRELFIAALPTARVAAFARRHGSLKRQGPPDWPQRDIPLDPLAPRDRPELRFLRSAAIEVGRLRLRVLVGDGAKPAIIGPRLWSRQRLGGMLGGLTVLAFGSASLLVWSLSAVQPSAAPLAAQSLDAAPAEPVALVALAAPKQPSQPASAAADSATGPAPAEAASAASAPAPPVVATAAADAAVGTDAAGIAGDPAAAVSGPAQVAAASPPAAVPAAAAAAADDGKVFAVAAMPTRSRASSQLRIMLMNAPTEPQPGIPHAEVMQIGAQWRAVIWPFASRSAAEQVRDTLAERGVKVDLISF